MPHETKDRVVQRILVTGLNGLIGWHCFLHASRKFETFGTFSRFHSPFNQSNCLFSNLDSKNLIRSLLEKARPTLIIHARCICDLDVCEIQPEMTERINVEGTQVLLEEAEKLGTVERFCYISTDHVFNGDRGAYTEHDAPCPKHVYGRTKVRAEELVKSSNLPYLIIRPGLAIGKSVQGNKGPHDWILSRLRQGLPSHLFTDEWRTPIWTDVLAEKILELCVSEQQGVFHLAGNTRINRYELGLALARREGVHITSLRSKLRAEDRWSHIRPKELTLKSVHFELPHFIIG